MKNHGSGFTENAKNVREETSAADAVMLRAFMILQNAHTAVKMEVIA